ncbi:hypothetical protein DAEQUDRAFT_267213 [Daedalea quercina L-15889]|uniref:Uncharacterized protein n=1 Tax=Daedalea quercina L-15889 TaxID=1314783 RepID=A0A165QH10_9APHY|nr:hypothetical protein DAEQUDRAFT_267213 [Daedalea quercina L-15889]
MSSRLYSVRTGRTAVGCIQRPGFSFEDIGHPPRAVYPTRRSWSRRKGAIATPRREQTDTSELLTALLTSDCIFSYPRCQMTDQKWASSRIDHCSSNTRTVNATLLPFRSGECQGCKGDGWVAGFCRTSNASTKPGKSSGETTTSCPKKLSAWSESSR